MQSTDAPNGHVVQHQDDEFTSAASSSQPLQTSRRRHTAERDERTTQRKVQLELLTPAEAFPMTLETMDFETILEQVYPWGLYQKRLWIVMMVLLDTIVGMNMLILMFAGKKADSWTCNDGDANVTTATDYPLTTTPWSTTVTVGTSANTGQNSGGGNFSSDGNSTNNTRAEECRRFDGCKNITFDESDVTFVSEAYLTTIIQLQMGGVMVGALFFGQLSELLGRRKVLFVSYLMGILAGGLLALSNSWVMIAVLFFFIGASAGGFWSAAFVLVQEIVGRRQRVFVLVLNGWPVAVMMLCFASFLLKEWRKLAITINVTGLSFLIFFVWIYESPRWLLQHKRFTEAREVLAKIAHVNSKQPPNISPYVEALILTDGPKDRRYTYWDVFKNRSIAVYTLALGYLWCVVTVISKGMLNRGVTNLPGDVYFNNFLVALVAAFSIWPLLVLARYLNRRYILIASLLAGAAFSLLLTITIVTQEHVTWITDEQTKIFDAIFGLLGSSSLGPAFIMIYLYSAECIPTVVRSLCNGFASSAGRVGLFLIAPAVSIGSAHGVRWPPFALFSAILLGTAVMVHFIFPDSRSWSLQDQLLPDDKHTVVDAKTGQRRRRVPLSQPHVNGKPAPHRNGQSEGAGEQKPLFTDLGRTHNDSVPEYEAGPEVAADEATDADEWFLALQPATPSPQCNGGFNFVAPSSPADSQLTTETVLAERSLGHRPDSLHNGSLPLSLSRVV